MTVAVQSDTETYTIFISAFGMVSATTSGFNVNGAAFSSTTSQLDLYKTETVNGTVGTATLIGNIGTASSDNGTDAKSRDSDNCGQGYKISLGPKTSVKLEFMQGAQYSGGQASQSSCKVSKIAILVQTVKR